MTHISAPAFVPPILEVPHPPAGPRPVASVPSPLAQAILELPPGAHLCLLYDRDPRDQLAALLPFILQGLAQNEQVIYVADDQTVDAFSDQLTRNGIDVARESAHGALQFWTRHQWRQPGPLDSGRKATQVRQLIDAAAAAGFSGIRFAIEMTWVLDSDLSVEELERWEATINTIFTPDFPVRMICQYDRSRLSPEAVIAALHTHPMAILGEHVCHNYFYQAPLILEDHGHDGENPSTARADWMISQLKGAHLAGEEREALVRERTALLETATARRKIVDILESITDGFIGFDAHGRFTFVNAAAEKILGQPASALIGNGDWQSHASTLDPEIAHACRRAVEECRSIEFEHFFAPAQRWFAIKAYPLASAGLSVNFRDIRDRKEAEAAMRSLRSELEVQVDDLRRLHDLSWRISGELDLQPILQEILRAVLAVHQADLGVITLADAQHDTLEVGVSSGFNPDFLRLIDHAPVDSAPCGLCYRQRQRVVVEDVELDERFASHREAARLGGFRAVHSTPLITRDGQAIGALSVCFRKPRRPYEREIRLVDLYVRQAADAIEGARLREQARRELSARKRADDADRRLAALVESSDDAIISKGLDGVIRSWNAGAQRIFKYTPEEAIGRPVMMLIPPDRHSEEDEILSRLRRGQRIEHYETIRIRKDGVRINVSLTVSPVKDAEGRVVGISKIAQDITERKRAEAALREAQAQLQAHADELEQKVLQRTTSLRDAIAQMEEFSYSISHDLRAPLRAMSTYAQILTEEYGHVLDDTGRDYLLRIERNSQRMDKLTQDILTYSRIARAEVELADVDLDQLLDDVLCQHTALQAPLADVRIQRPLLPVRAHEPSLAQCVTNLLMNAVKFVAPGTQPQVRVRTEAMANRVRLWIEDNGIGVPPEFHRRLFHVFERLHQRDHYEGTGIGLAIVRKAVEKMGGQCGVESDGRHGSRFWLELSRR